MSTESVGFDWLRRSSLIRIPVPGCWLRQSSFLKLVLFKLFCTTTKRNCHAKKTPQVSKSVESCFKLFRLCITRLTQHYAFNKTQCYVVFSNFTCPSVSVDCNSLNSTDDRTCLSSTWGNLAFLRNIKGAFEQI